MGWFSDDCGPPYTESYDHEFEPGSGTSAGGVNQAAYCKICGVTQSMHGGGGQVGGSDDDLEDDDDEYEDDRWGARA